MAVTAMLETTNIHHQAIPKMKHIPIPTKRIVRSDPVTKSPRVCARDIPINVTLGFLPRIVPPRNHSPTMSRSMPMASFIPSPPIACLHIYYRVTFWQSSIRLSKVMLFVACSPRNTRKGGMTDGEFRRKYALAPPGKPGVTCVVSQHKGQATSGKSEFQRNSS